MRPSRLALVIAVAWTALLLVIAAQVLSYERTPFHLATVVGSSLRQGEALVCLPVSAMREPGTPTPRK